MSWFKTYCNDIKGFDEIDEKSIDIAITSPPYKKKDGYSIELIEKMATLFEKTLKTGGRAFVNFGQLREDFGRIFQVPKIIDEYSSLQMGQSIIWVKSIAVKGKQLSHYQPINSTKLLNYCWEVIYSFYKEEEKEIDRLSIGVPFSDKSNLHRANRGKNGDIHCAGDVWHIPYKTMNGPRKHPHEFPIELVTRILKLSNLPKDSVVLDPFLGSGTTAIAAKKMGMNVIGIDISNENISFAEKRFFSA